MEPHPERSDGVAPQPPGVLQADRPADLGAGKRSAVAERAEQDLVRVGHRHADKRNSRFLRKPPGLRGGADRQISRPGAQIDEKNSAPFPAPGLFGSKRKDGVGRQGSRKSPAFENLERPPVADAPEQHPPNGAPGKSLPRLRPKRAERLSEGPRRTSRHSGQMRNGRIIDGGTDARRILKESSAAVEQRLRTSQRRPERSRAPPVRRLNGTQRSCFLRFCGENDHVVFGNSRFTQKAEKRFEQKIVPEVPETVISEKRDVEPAAHPMSAPRNFAQRGITTRRQRNRIATPIRTPDHQPLNSRKRMNDSGV